MALNENKLNIINYFKNIYKFLVENAPLENAPLEKK